ncbi:MAG TPA: hypothetical protein VI056_12855 [Candidatus Limnocylindria bacterium]
MAEPKTTGEAIQLVRAALYDLARRPGWRGHATQPEILGYCIERKWSVPVSAFEKAIAQLHGFRAVEIAAGDQGKISDIRYWLTAAGDLEEEEKRRGWRTRVVDELRKPRTFVEFAFVLLGFGLGLLSGWLIASAK